MATLTIHSFSFTPSLAAPQVVHTKWRLTSAPDVTGSYTAASDVTANADGTLTTPLAITVPVDNITVVATSACSSTGFPKAFSLNYCCTTGYTLSGTTCTHIDTTAATSTGSTPVELCHYTNGNYAQYGSIIYSTYNTNGTSIASPDLTLVNSNAGGASTSTVWGNPASNIVDGRLNKTAVWDCADQTTAGDLGFGFQFSVPTNKTYYIGFGADNTSKLSVDGVVLINQDAAAIGTALCGGSTHIECAFKYWHIYPISLTQGTHLINVVGNNAGSVGAFGCEIYNATAAQLIGCTTASGTYSDTTLATTNLHRYIVFTTEATEDNTISDIGNWTCPTGYTLINTGSGYSCQQVTNTAAGVCMS